MCKKIFNGNVIFLKCVKSILLWNPDNWCCVESIFEPVKINYRNCKLDCFVKKCFIFNSINFN